MGIISYNPEIRSTEKVAIYFCGLTQATGSIRGSNHQWVWEQSLVPRGFVAAERTSELLWAEDLEQWLSLVTQAGSLLPVSTWAGDICLLKSWPPPGPILHPHALGDEQAVMSRTHFNECDVARILHQHTQWLNDFRTHEPVQVNFTVQIIFPLGKIVGWAKVNGKVKTQRWNVQWKTGKNWCFLMHMGKNGVGLKDGSRCVLHFCGRFHPSAQFILPKWRYWRSNWAREDWASVKSTWKL